MPFEYGANAHRPLFLEAVDTNEDSVGWQIRLALAVVLLDVDDLACASSISIRRDSRVAVRALETERQQSLDELANRGWICGRRRVQIDGSADTSGLS